LLALLLAVGPPPPGHFSVDETGQVSHATLVAFDDIARTLQASGAGELGLAVVSSTRGVKPRQFATDVFNQWGIGHAGRNDGVLLFIALSDRKSEIIVGSGFPPGSTARTDAIMLND